MQKAASENILGRCRADPASLDLVSIAPEGASREKGLTRLANGLIAARQLHCVDGQLVARTAPELCGYGIHR